ncbi:MAG: glycosyltransferase family 2 protein [Crenarchaeota archaeon]|nr:glycosyltransferase family 2 protein [Thermoproteota archaeon]
MNIFTAVSIVFLSIILSWAIYNAYVLISGLRSKQKYQYAHLENLPKFSLVVPAKDERNVITRCLTSLLEIDYPKDKLEIIVVNGDSQDDTLQICQEYSRRNPDVIKVISEKTSKGKPAALNCAFPYITGELVGIFDADSVPEKAVLKKAASYFQNDSIKALQGSTSCVNASQNMLTRTAAMEDKGWFQGLLGGREKLKLFVPLTGSCQFVRKNILSELGGWDESSLAEDVELSLRLTKKNYLVTFAPDISSGQEAPSSLRRLVSQRTRWYRGYMEASFKYGSLLERINRKTIDAEISLVGPFVMVICLASYFNWGFSLFFSPENSLPIVSSFLIVALTSVTLISLGLMMFVFVKPLRLRSILWVPFVYLYWMLQMLIAAWAFLLIVFRRPKVWQKTEKDGLFTDSGLQEKSGV